MSTATFDSQVIAKKHKETYENITTLVISNYGNNVLWVTIRGVKRPVPPADNSLGTAVPVAPFVIESYGHGFTIEVLVEFNGGIGNAIIDTIKIKEC